MNAAATSANDFFGATQPVHAWAPGRVNLLGEHTDYNDGYMLPVATPQRTDVLAAPSDDGQFHAYSATRDDYEVSIAALDVLTEVLRKDPDVHGARLTGAMHVTSGGACVALCRTGTAAAAGRRAVTRVNAAGAAATLLIPASTQ